MKPAAFLYTTTELYEKEIKKKPPYTIVSKAIKYLVINVIKEMMCYTHIYAHYMLYVIHIHMHTLMFSP